MDTILQICKVNFCWFELKYRFYGVGQIPFALKNEVQLKAQTNEY